MSTITLGKTGLVIEKNGFGCLPIQRLTKEEAVRLLRMAYDGGMTYFDTARAYSDSEEKVGAAFDGMRDKVVIATKTHAGTGAELKEHLETSLRNLRTGYIDLYQIHNLPEREIEQVFSPGGAWEALAAAREAGKIGHIGVTAHSADALRVLV